jgi:hypothetical protein
MVENFKIYFLEFDFVTIDIGNEIVGSGILKKICGSKVNGH